MDALDKAVKKVKEVGNSVVSTAVDVGNTIGNVAKEQTEIASIKSKKKEIAKKLEVTYAQIGKEYVSSLKDVAVESNMTDLLEILNSQLDELEQVEAQLNEIEAKNREANLAKERKKAESKFESEKEKLDKALAMEIITEEEYNEKLSAVQKKLDNYEMIKKIDLQYEMQIITKEEHDAKINSLLG